MKKVFILSVFLCLFSFVNAQIGNVGVNTKTPQTRLDVNGNVQLRNELQINGSAGTAGQVYFSQGNAAANNWKSVNVPFLIDGQYQLVNTYAKRDQIGIDWVGEVANSTIEAFPFTETFETASTTRGLWTNEYVSGTYSWTYAAGAGGGGVTTAHGGSVNAQFRNSNTTNRTKLVSPKLNFSGLPRNMRLSFWYAQPQNGGTANQNYLGVYYRTSSDGNTWTSWTQIGSNYTTSVTSWTQLDVELPNSGDAAYYQIAFDGQQRGTGWGNAIDDVNIYDSPFFTETFETTSTTRSQWTVNDYVSGSTSWAYAAGSTATITTANGGSLNARFGNSGTTNQTRLQSPSFNFSGYSNNMTLSFWYGQPRNGTNTNLNYLGVYYRTSANGSWTQIGSNYTGNVTSWTQVSNLELPNSAGAAYYQVAFLGQQRGTGYANVIDDVVINGQKVANAFVSTLSTLGESINSKNWTRIPGLDLPVKVSSNQNKISMIFQTGAESRLNPGNDATAQTAGYIRYMCGVFSRKSSEAPSAAKLVAMRPNQVDNYAGKTNQQKAQDMLTLTYVVQDTEAGEYVFSTACRRLSLSGGGGSTTTSLFSIGNRVDSGDNLSSDFLLNSIVKMDIIDLVTVAGN